MTGSASPGILARLPGRRLAADDETEFANTAVWLRAISRLQAGTGKYRLSLRAAKVSHRALGDRDQVRSQRTGILDRNGIFHEVQARFQNGGLGCPISDNRSFVYVGAGRDGPDSEIFQSRLGKQLEGGCQHRLVTSRAAAPEAFSFSMRHHLHPTYLF